MKNYFQFTPDLIVEATSVCDRACVGCYAPNVVSKESAESLYQKNPSLFVNPSSVQKILTQFSHQQLTTISIRGGEPTRHPKLNEIFDSCNQAASTVVLETHGRWLLSDSDESKGLLGSLVKHEITVKISFDKMHGLKAAELKIITDSLEKNKISYLVAITEVLEQEFLVTRSLCSWISDAQIIFQKKSFSQDDLIKPAFGVLSVSGDLVSQLHTKENGWTSQHQERATV